MKTQNISKKNVADNKNTATLKFEIRIILMIAMQRAAPKLSILKTYYVIKYPVLLYMIPYYDK